MAAYANANATATCGCVYKCVCLCVCGVCVKTFCAFCSHGRRSLVSCLLLLLFACCRFQKRSLLSCPVISIAQSRICCRCCCRLTTAALCLSVVSYLTNPFSSSSSISAPFSSFCVAWVAATM